MIDLGSTTVDIQRHPPTNKEVFSQKISNSVDSSPPRVLIFRNEQDMSDASTEEHCSKASFSPMDNRYEMQQETRSEDEILNDDQEIVKVDPKTPPLLSSPECVNDKSTIWNEAEARSPNSVIIKVEPRTPSPIMEEESDHETEQDAKHPEFSCGMFTILFPYLP